MLEKSPVPFAAAGPAVRRPAVLGGRALFDRDVFVTRPVMPDPEAFARRTARLFASHWLTNEGPLMVALETRLAVAGLRTQRIADDTVENHFNLTIEIDPEAFGLDRDAVHRALLAEHVVTRKYFHPLCSENPCYRDLPSTAPGALPHARRVASRILSLPLYGALEESAVHGIAETLGALHANAPAVRRSLGGGGA